VTSTQADIGADIGVDVVIDNHNYGHFLASAIDSALDQTHPRVRVVVVDDGSTDDSRAVIARYGSRVTAVLKENGGQASAINAGFAHRDGEVVIFLDADDVLLPDTAARVAAAFAHAPATAKLQYPMAVIDAAGRPTGELRPRLGVVLPHGDLRRAQLTFPFDVPWTAMSANAFSARALRAVLPVPEEEFRSGADWYLGHLVPLRGPVAALEAVGARYRVHGANGYARLDHGLDLEFVRQTVRLASATRRHLHRHAATLALERRPGPILSVADLAYRMVSRKLAPRDHPLPRDRVARLAAGGIVAAQRRGDVGWSSKLTFMAWFAAMALAPRRVARPLATAFLLDDSRARVAARVRALGGRG
jgi:hypothetical protein